MYKFNTITDITYKNAFLYITSKELTIRIPVLDALLDDSYIDWIINVLIPNKITT